MHDREGIVQEFLRDGYTVIEDVLSPREDLWPIVAECEAVAKDLARRLFAEGRTRCEPADGLFSEQLIALSKVVGPSLSQEFDISLPLSRPRRDTPIYLGSAVFSLLTNTALLDVVESFLGGEILASPVQHLRMKLPSAIVEETADGLMGSVPWHQDGGVVLPEADNSHVLTVWIPLSDVSVDSGCLAVVAGSHREGLRVHCPSPVKGPLIPASGVRRDRVRPLPMRAGSVLLLHRHTIHSSLDNVTKSNVRLSLDLRFQRVGEPTGRPQFPAFVARSTADPDTELHSAKEWAEMWYEVRTALSEGEVNAFNRWSVEVPGCA